VFVSSPGDVAEERFITKRVLQRLYGEFAPFVKVNPIFWEHEPLLASDSFQEQIPLPSQSDIVICILWSRLGTRLPHEFTNPDGTPRYKTGTEFEFDDALKGRKQRGSPDLLVYRKTAEPLVSLKDTGAAAQALQQKVLLDQFVLQFFHGEDGTLIAAFQPFDNAADFETRLEEHLRKLILARLERLGVDLAHRGEVVAPTWTKGSPFRGLAVFDYEHHAIFFGRTRAIGDVIERLKRQAADGRAFLLILGVSGCGKSSLIRAGVLPMLVQPAVVEGVGLWRRAIVRPSERSGDLFDGLAAALLRPEALPELAADGTTAEKLAADLRNDPGAAPHMVKGALSQAVGDLRKAAESAIQPAARLVLVFDQLEELFTVDSVSPEQRAAYFRAIRSLAISGQTWVIATLRSDFYHHCAEIPALGELKAGSGQYDLAPPDPSEIAHLVRRPACAAGLRFEEDLQTGERLDDQLRDAAAANRDSLPLLEFTLDELYRRRSSCVLTLAAYRELGGIEGALARRADEVFNALPEAARKSLARVFRELVAVGEGEGERPTRKPASLDAFGKAGESAPPRQLVDAFIDARLLTAKEGKGAAVVEVTHEALLSRWQPLVEWLAHDRELLLVRGRIAVAAMRWDREGRRGDRLLSTGKPLDEAKQLLAAGFDLNALETDFIAASRAQARRRRNTRRLAITAVHLLAITALIAAIYANRMSLRAIANAARADANAQAAVAAKQEAEGRSYAANMRLAQQAATDGDIAKAATFLDHFRTVSQGIDFRGFEWRYLCRLCEGDSRNTYHGFSDQVWSVAFSPDGKLLATSSLDSTVRVFDVATRRQVSIFRLDGPGVMSAAFSPDGRTLACTTGNWQGTQHGNLYLCDWRAGLLGSPISGHVDGVNSVVFSRDGRYLATCSEDDSTILWKIKGPHTVARESSFAGHTRGVNAVAFTPDSRYLAAGTGGGHLQVWEVATKRPLIDQKVDVSGIMSLVFAPDNKTLLVGARDGPIRFWDIAERRALDVLDSGQGQVNSLAISADGQQFVSGGSDSTIAVWSLAGRRLLTQLGGHRGSVLSVACSPAGPIVASGSADGTVKLWDANRKREVPTLRYEAAVSTLAFSPDGQILAVAGGARAEVGPQPVIAGARVPQKNIWFWKIGTAEPPAVLHGHDDVICSVAFSPDGRTLASGCEDHSVALWDVASKRRKALWTGHNDAVVAVRFSPDDSILATGSRDNTIKLWDATKLAAMPLATLSGHESTVYSLSFSADGKLLASASADRTVRVWQLATRLSVAQPDSFKGTCRSVEFSPDGRLLAAASADRTVHLWNAANGKAPFEKEATLFGYKSALNSLAFSPDGKTLAAGSEDASIILWSLSTKQEVAAFAGHRGGVSCVAFAPDGNVLATGSNDQTVKLWYAAKRLDPGVSGRVSEGWTEP
jgi:WD40 repeat protein